MYKCLIFASIFSLLAAARIHLPEERIVGGMPIPIEYVPWQVALLNNGLRWCGGSILSERVILTAAHCVDPQEIGILTVRAGSSDWRFGGQEVGVAMIKSHEYYRRGAGDDPYERDQDYSVRAGSVSKSFGGQEMKVAKSIARNGSDIAMLFLSFPLKFDQFTKSIELAETSPVAETKATVSGWGRLSYNPAAAPGPYHLWAVNVTVKDRTRCQAAFNAMAVLLAEEPLILKDDTICASLLGDGACKGDSGGPLVSLNGPKLIGIVSYGIRCLSPGVYVDVALMKDWIEKTARKYGY